MAEVNKPLPLHQVVAYARPPMACVAYERQDIARLPLVQLPRWTQAVGEQLLPGRHSPAQPEQRPFDKAHHVQLLQDRDHVRLRRVILSAVGLGSCARCSQALERNGKQHKPRSALDLRHKARTRTNIGHTLIVRAIPSRPVPSRPVPSCPVMSYLCSRLRLARRVVDAVGDVHEVLQRVSGSARYASCSAPGAVL